MLEASHFDILPVGITRTVQRRVHFFLGGITILLVQVIGSTWTGIEPQIFGIITLPIGLFVLWLSTLWFRDHMESVAIFPNYVRITRIGRKFGEYQATASISSYKCVLWQQTKKRFFSRKGKGHVIKMTHSDSAMNIVLYAGYSELKAREIWLKSAEAVNLPREKKDTIETESNYQVYFSADDDGQGGESDGDSEGNGGE